MISLTEDGGATGLHIAIWLAFWLVGGLTAGPTVRLRFVQRFQPSSKGVASLLPLVLLLTVLGGLLLGCVQSV